MSSFREPVIGDDHDLETYGRPSQQRAAVRTHQPRAHANYDRAATRARRAPVEEKSRIDADGVRTVKISGQATPPRRSGSGRSSAQRSLSVQIDRYDRRPDRAAQWALFMGVFMIVVAIATGT